MTLEENNYSADFDLTQKEHESENPLVSKLKKEHENFLAVVKNDYLENSNYTNVSTEENLKISTAINKSLDLDIDNLFTLANTTASEYKDITKEQLMVVLLQSIASTNDNKLMRKVAKKLIKKVGK